MSECDGASVCDALVRTRLLKGNSEFVAARDANLLLPEVRSSVQQLRKTKIVAGNLNVLHVPGNRSPWCCQIAIVECECLSIYTVSSVYLTARIRPGSHPFCVTFRGAHPNPYFCPRTNSMSKSIF